MKIEYYYCPTSCRLMLPRAIGQTVLWVAIVFTILSFAQGLLTAGICWGLMVFSIDRLTMEQVNMFRKRTMKDIPARFQMEMKREDLDELEQLRILGGLASKRELFNNALTLLKWAIKQKQLGYAIAVVNQDNQIIKELEMPYLESIASNSRRSLRLVEPGEKSSENDHQPSDHRQSLARA